MKKIILSVLAAAVLNSSLYSVSAYRESAYLQVPQSLSPKAVYYIKSTQLNDFSCSFNALFNALNLGQVCRVKSPYSFYDLFRETCSAFCYEHRIKPKGAVSTAKTSKLARDYLRMKNVCNLGIRKGKIHVFFETATRYYVPYGAGQHAIEAAEDNALQSRGDTSLRKIREAFDSRFGRTLVMHFICTVDTEEGGHAILVTLIQNKTGRGLYIFDNMNRAFQERSQLKQFVQFLCTEFGVSSRSQFQGPPLPHRWESLPAEPVYWY